MGAFAMAKCRVRLSGPAYDTLAEGKIRSAVLYVALSFRENNQKTSAEDEDSKLRQLLSQQCRAFRNKNPNPVQYKCVPVCVIREIAKNKLSEIKWEIGNHGGSAFFFAERSCEYLKCL
jgi:hypothetical protein